MIEHVQKHLKHEFTLEEIEAGALKDLITEEDYDIIKVVSTYCLISIPECLNFEACNTFCGSLRNVLNYVQVRNAVYLKGVLLHSDVITSILAGNLLLPSNYVV